MAGSVFFSHQNWAGRSSTTFYLFEFLADQLPEGSSKAELQELVDNNIAMLDLSDAAQSELVDLIADDLPLHIESVEDPEIRENLGVQLSDLVSLAKEQQSMNRRRAGTQ